MDFTAVAPVTCRSRITAALTASSFALVVGLIAYGASLRASGLPGIKSFSLLLIPLSVYFVGRFARTSVVVPFLAVLLLSVAGWMAQLPQNPSDEWRWAEVAVLALTGASLLLKVKWAPYLWYLTVSGFAAGSADIVVDAVKGDWGTMTAAVLAGALLLITVGVGALQR